MGILLALAAALLYGGSDFGGGLASRRLGSLRVAVVGSAAATVLTWATLILAGGPGPSLRAVAWGLASGLAGGAGTLVLYRGLARGQMSVVGPLSAVGAAVVPVAAGVALGERPSLLSVAGVLVALPAIVLVAASGSVRGSQAGEMMARCIVETGTSSYYSALKDAAQEPVLKQVCAKIAADEFRHYKLFYAHLRRCLKRDRLSRWSRLRIGWCRLAESEDDELAYAYFAANEPHDAVYDRKRSMQAYARRAYPLYRQTHVQRAMAMVLKAIGLQPQGWLNRLLTRIGLWFLSRNAAKLAEQGA